MKLLAAISDSSLFLSCYFSQIPGEFVGGGTGDEHAQQGGWLVINEMEK
jgi:hypothetical protein